MLYCYVYNYCKDFVKSKLIIFCLNFEFGFKKNICFILIREKKLSWVKWIKGLVLNLINENN